MKWFLLLFLLTQIWNIKCEKAVSKSAPVTSSKTSSTTASTTASKTPTNASSLTSEKPSTGASTVTNETRSTSASTVTSKTPSTSASTSKTPSTSASTSKTPSTSASTSKTPSTNASTSKTPSTSASTSKTPSTSASTSKTPSTSASTSPTPSSSASTSKTPSTSASTSKTPSTSASTSPTPSTNASTSKTPSTSASTVTSKTPSTNASTSKTPSTSASTVTSPTPSTSASTSKTPSTSASTSKTPSTNASTSKTPSTSASTVTSPTPSTSASTSKTPSTSASTSKPSSTNASTSKTPSTSASTVTSKTPSTNASTSKTPSTNASTSKTPSTSASTSKTPSTSASTSKTPSTSASTSKTPSTSASTSETPSTNASLLTSEKPSTNASSITHTDESTARTTEHATVTTQMSWVTTEVHATEVSPTTNNSTIYEGKLVIAEIYYNEVSEGQDGHDICEFVELYGDANMDLSNYTLLFFDEKKNFLSVPLTNHKTNDNGSFVIAVTNGSSFITNCSSSYRVDLEISNSIYRPPVTMATIYKHLKPQVPAHNSSTMLQVNGSLVDYVAYGNGSEVPDIVKDFIPNSTIKKTGKNLQESISRCFSAEPKDQRAFTLSRPTPGLPNDCVELDLKINEIRYAAEGDDNSCFIEFECSHDASHSLNSYVVVIYSTRVTKTLDLWNMRTDNHGYFLLDGNLMGYIPEHIFNCKEELVNGTMVILLYQILTENGLRAPFLKENIKQQVAFNTTSPIDADLLEVMNQDLGPLYHIYSNDEVRNLLSGRRSLSLCSSSYMVLPPTPAYANKCPSTMTTSGAVRTTVQQSNHVLINEITISSRGSEQFIELRGDKGGNLESYYVALFDGCSGSIITTLSINRHLNKRGFLKLDTSVDSDMDFSKHLQQGDILAIGLYQQKPTSINKTDSLVDAVSVMSSDHNDCRNLPLKAKSILARNSEIITITSDEMKHLISLSRCSSNSRRKTEEFQVLKQSSPDSDNIGCNPDIKPKHSKMSKQIMVTVAVVVSCIVLFLIIVAFVVVIMKRKKRGLQQFGMTRLYDDDDDEELITNMDRVEDISGEPTFQSQMYSKLKVKDDDDSLVQF